MENLHKQLGDMMFFTSLLGRGVAQGHLSREDASCGGSSSPALLVEERLKDAV